MKKYKTTIKLSWSKELGPLNEKRNRKKAVFYQFLKELGYIDKIPTNQFEAKMLRYENTV